MSAHGFRPHHGPGLGRLFVAYWFFVGWDCTSLGLHICWSCPNIEVHLPFGFIRVGWVNDGGATWRYHEAINGWIDTIRRVSETGRAERETLRGKASSLGVEIER